MDTAHLKLTLKAAMEDTKSRIVSENTETDIISNISKYTALRPSAVLSYLKSNNIPPSMALDFVKNGAKENRMDFVTAVSGKPGNPFSTRIISKLKPW